MLTIWYTHNITSRISTTSHDSYDTHSICLTACTLPPLVQLHWLTTNSKLPTFLCACCSPNIPNTDKQIHSHIKPLLVIRNNTAKIVPHLQFTTPAHNSTITLYLFAHLFTLVLFKHHTDPFFFYSSTKQIITTTNKQFTTNIHHMGKLINA